MPQLSQADVAVAMRDARPSDHPGIRAVPAVLAKLNVTSRREAARAYSSLR